MLTVKQLKEQLNGMPDDMPVYVYDLAYADLYRIEVVDTDLGNRLDINIDTNSDGVTIDEA